MSESSSPTPPPAGMPHVPTPSTATPPLAALGGMIGIAACAIGMAIFLGGCAGFHAAFALALIPLIGGGVGLLVTILGGVFRHTGIEHTPVLAGLFLNVFAIVGGVLEWALWNDWPIFHRVVAS